MNTGTTFSVVKTTLNSFCKEKAKALPWESVIKDMNKAVLEAYVLANIHVVRLCQANLPIEPLNNIFFYRCLSATASGVQESRDCEQLKQSVALYNEWRGTGVDRANKKYITDGWQQNASMQMATNTTNAVNLNFYRRFHKHFKRKYDFDGRQAYATLKHILDLKYEGDDPIVLEWRARIPRREVDGKLNSQSHLLLPLTYTFLSDIEERNRVNQTSPDYVEIRSFSLLPLKRGFECSHFKMCKIGLRGLLKRAGINIPSKGPKWNAVSDEWWRELFNIDKFETANRKFAGEIVTDGKAVSILMRKPKQKIGTRELKEEDYDVMWGLNPGRRDLFVATNQNGEKISCSSREFYEDARYKKRNQKIKVWQENRPDILEAARNMPTKKTAQLERLKEYVVFMIPRMDLLLQFSIVKPFRKLKLRSFIFAQKKLRELCLKLTAQAGRRTLVGFGDWSNQDIGGLIKKCPSGPVKPLERMLRQYCRVESVDEFRSSKLHERCHTPLSHQYSKRMCRDGIERILKVHGVLHCKNNGCHGMTVNRDNNASKNMLLLLQLQI
uniref:Uncharacterized protein n=1 Tax=Globisporangium ultimum (strain ATCC 200006 / CBS 805.95 / DAOM BR144) TaxID=431595 RepID=K3X3E2_GLOUD